jgi:hypothetical protein
VLSFSSGDAIALVRTVVWPAVALIVLLVYRRQLPGFVGGLAGRVRKVSVASISLEFAEATEFEPPATVNFLSALQEPLGAGSFSSRAGALDALLRQGERADYAVFDLGAGKSWLSSRLYVTAVVLPRVLGWRCLVFVESSPGFRRYIGLASPERVSERLGRSFTWMNAALANALASSSLPPYGHLEPHEGQMVVNGFLQDPKIQRAVVPPVGPPQPAPAAAPVPAPAAPADPWVPIENGALEEHGSYVSPMDLHRIMDDALLQPTLEIIPGMPDQAKLEAVLAEKAEFVARTRTNGAFVGLIDRRAAVEKLAAAAAASGA